MPPKRPSQHKRQSAGRATGIQRARVRRGAHSSTAASRLGDVGSGAPNGVSSRRPFDRWFRYPAGFSQGALAAALDVLELEVGDLIVDPFAGSASAGSRALELGATYVGIEAHPLIAELAHLKFLRPGDPQELRQAASALAGRVKRAPTGGETLLVQRCFDEATLTVLVALRNELQQAAHERWATHLKWALLATLRDVASVKVGWPYQRPSLRRQAPHIDVRERFVARAHILADDLADAPDASTSRVVAGDSTSATSWRQALDGQVAKGCVTSPPYLNNFDYADATRLEVYFWRQATSWAELCSEIRSGMLVATTQQARQPLSDRAIEQLAIFPRLASDVRPLIDALATERRRRPRGKEYDRVLAPYFLGLARVLSHMHSHLALGARCAWVIGDSAPYGVHIDTPALVSCLATELGYETGEDILLRGRGQRWRTNGTRHQVALSERLVTFTRAGSSGISWPG